MARYASADDMRQLTGLSTLSTDPDYIEDSKLEYYLDKACTLMLEDFCITNIEESLSGNIDGSNTTFEVANTPISDITFDKTVNASDVTVYTWGDTSDPTTRSTVSVSTLYPHEGKIVLSSAPASTFADVTCTYRHYLSETIRFDLLPLANAYLAGWIYISSEFFLQPEQKAIGAIRWTFKDMPPTRILESYYKVTNLIKTKHWSKKQHGDIKLLRG